MEPRRRNPLRRYPAAVCISLLHFGLTQSKTRALNSPADAPNGAWQCKIFTFGNVYSNLRVYFYEDGSDVWRVNSWQVYP